MKPEIESKVVIKDCRGKEDMVLTRYGGDAMLSFYEGDRLKFITLFQMKKPHKQNWQKIVKLFEELKSKLVQK